MKDTFSDGLVEQNTEADSFFDSLASSLDHANPATAESRVRGWTCGLVCVTIITVTALIVAAMQYGEDMHLKRQEVISEAEVEIAKLLHAVP
jgi:hypothetical protein